VLEKMVPRDGVEPPTPAFSGLNSATNHLVVFSFPATQVQSSHAVFRVSTDLEVTFYSKSELFGSN
jgi:hypothetical protein